MILKTRCGVIALAYLTFAGCAPTELSALSDASTAADAFEQDLGSSLDAPDAVAQTDAVTATDAAVTTDAVTATDVVAPRDVVVATDVVAPRDVVVATDVVAPRDVVVATDVVVPRDVVVATDVVVPRDVVVATDVVVPRDVVVATDVVVPPVDVVDPGCTTTARVTAPTPNQEIETCTASGGALFFNFAVETTGPVSRVSAAWRTPRGDLAPSGNPSLTAPPWNFRRQIGGMMSDQVPLGVFPDALRGTWRFEATVVDRCGRSSLVSQPFTLIYTSRRCPNP